ncbi:MAG: amidohydrolase, partial [Candidatus Dormibacteraceae bacterium]
MKPRQVWFRGGSIEVLTGDEGRILAVGPALRSVAGYECQIVELRGEVLPGLHDAHLHLGYLVEARRQVDLHGVQSIDETVDRLSKHASNLSQTAWVVGRGWDLTKSARFTKAELRRLEVAVGGRPFALKGEDGHSCWGSRAALTAAGISEQTSDVAGGIIERDQAGNVTGILREGACALLTRMRPKLSGQEFEAGLAEVLGELARFGLTTVHSMDGIEEWEALQRLRRQGRLPLRVVSYFRYPELELAAEVRRLVGSDPWLRVGGIKAFLDGTLSSRTAAMVGG